MSRVSSHDRLTDYDFSYPERLTAQIPVEPRDTSRLLVRHAGGRIEHCRYFDLPDKLQPGTLLVVNDTGVVPCRIMGNLPTGGKVELLLLDCWQLVTTNEPRARLRAMARPMKKLSSGLRVDVPVAGLKVEILEKLHEGSDHLVEILFDRPGAEVLAALNCSGIVPLPPYIKRTDLQVARDSTDRDLYQTVFAKMEGSSAAPTAGLHMTDQVLDNLRKRQIEIAKITLHVGLGTFAPVRDELIARHSMHGEVYRIPRQAAKAIAEARRDERPIVYLGTTAFRAAESWLLRAAAENVDPETLCDQWLDTKLFIHPSSPSDAYRPQAAQGLLTNFHQPKSTLFMLVCALLGIENAQRLYETAIAEEYRLFSYGDASLLWL